MGIVSYAQNFEDVMLWRALKDVKNGFYIDIGANDPVIDSVTKAFYENGWSGINVEPEYELYELLKEDRVRDINLNIAISSKLDYIDFYVSSTRGWSTTDKDSSINLKEKESFLEKRKVNAMTLDKLCNKYDVEEVHFLKIDVEGAEKDVLESFSFEKVRPWICVIEATKPTTQVDISYEWEKILIKNDYNFVYFDGLNKYYISEEHKELVERFKSPPNVFDDFILAVHKNSILKAKKEEIRANEAYTKIKKIQVYVDKLEFKINDTEAKVDELQSKVKEVQVYSNNIEVKSKEYLDLYNSVINSTSWKMTKPFRIIGIWVRKLINFFKIDKKEELINEIPILNRVKKDVEDRKNRYMSMNNE